MAVAAIASHRDGQRFYVWLAAIFSAITLFSFVPTYWQPLVGGRLDGGAPVLHIHAFLFSVWPLFFLTQTWLAATSRMAMHRIFGPVGAAIAVAMIWSGLWVTAFSIKLQSDLGYPFQARGFGIISFTKIVFFGTCVALALTKVRKPNVHKRLMVLAMFPLVSTALGRILYLLAPPGSPQRPGLGEPPPAIVGVPGAVVMILVLLAILFFDRRATGRLHPVYLIGGIAFVAMDILREFARSTDAWQTVAMWLAGFA